MVQRFAFIAAMLSRFRAAFTGPAAQQRGACSARSASVSSRRPSSSKPQRRSTATPASRLRQFGEFGVFVGSWAAASRPTKPARGMRQRRLGSLHRIVGHETSARAGSIAGNTIVGKLNSMHRREQQVISIRAEGAAIQLLRNGVARARDRQRGMTFIA